MSPGRVFLVAMAGVACGCMTHPPIAETPAARSCVYLTEHTGARYSLAYPGHTCSRAGYVALPDTRIDDVDAWCINAMGTVAPIQVFRIRGRLATLDRRSKHGFSIHRGGFWRQTKWAWHTEMAHAALVDARASKALIDEEVEAPLRRMGLVDESSTWFEIEDQSLSSRQRAQLIAIFARAEARFAADQRMVTPRRTVDEVLRAKPGYARGPIVRFRVDP